MDKTKQAALFVAGALLAIMITAGATGSNAAEPSGCSQWEVTYEVQSVVVRDTRKLDEATIKQAPAGWEPFAIGQSGLLVYRRCAK